MPRKPRYRPPASSPPANAPGFDRWLLEQLRLIGEDLQGSGTTDVDSLIRQERLDLPAGATRRVSPTLSGTVVVLEAPSGENAAQTATLLIEDPRGEVQVTASPHRTADGKVALSLINGARTATFTRSGVVVFYSNGIDQWKTVAESPAESGAIGATGPAGPPGADGVGGAMRRIRRHLFKPDGTCDITENGVTTNVALTSFGLATDGQAYKVWVCPGGTGGCRSGKQRNTTVSDNVGSGGPGGGAIAEDLFFRDDLEAYIAALGTDIPITVGAGGAGAPDGPFGEINNVGAVGTLGGLSAFGSLLVAYPGGLGQNPGSISTSATGGGGGGGWAGPGINGSTSSLTASRPVTSIGSSGNQGDGTFGGGTGYSSASNSPGLSIYGGGGGGGNASGGAANGVGAGRSIRGIPGAGSGGSVDATGVTPRAGGDAGLRGAFTDGLATSGPAPIGGGPAGGAGATGNTGNDGADGADGVPGLYPGESGAGGGALVCTTSGGTGLSGRGGDGGYPGGSGGTGGACFNDSDTLVTNCAAGGGGDGADGCVVVDTLG